MEPMTPSTIFRTARIDGYTVQAIDGQAGCVDRSTFQIRSPTDIVVATGWLFASRVLLPADAIVHVDHAHECIYINRSKADIKEAPLLDYTDY